MYKSIFITGTDTGIGKTFVSVGLLKSFKEMGYNVCPMKPLESGCDFRKGKLIPEDTVRLIEAAEVNEAIDLINPYRFKQHLAPAVAAEIEGIIISRKKILSAYRRLIRKYDLTIVEGAGGIMVPVHKKYLFIDLVKDLDLPVLIIARQGLGTINHALLTLAAAKNRGIKVIGVIMNYSTHKIKNDISEKTNPVMIEQLGEVSVLATVPYFKNADTDHYRKIFMKIAKGILSV